MIEIQDRQPMIDGVQRIVVCVAFTGAAAFAIRSER